MQHPQGIVVAVTGGRTNRDRPGIYRKLDQLHAQHRFSLLIEGGARGADRLCREWAIERCVPHITIPANWNTLGQKAGSIRNGQMLSLGPNAVVAFRGRDGTTDMVRQARERGIPVW